MFLEGETGNTRQAVKSLPIEAARPRPCSFFPLVKRVVTPFYGLYLLLTHFGCIMDQTYFLCPSYRKFGPLQALDLSTSASPASYHLVSSSSAPPLIPFAAAPTVRQANVEG
ncbi:hypothetical protein Naga_101211g2 [Nannochloropsis gaditana]|uniref:Uncharacterized protein n=1 Tax=Nannochloropsis gaditana TaxID=72520 RepID=W7T179_9STRA|nr:hypothetical protein Naga_101211g2 [Nannochloropsis gaditana]